MGTRPPKIGEKKQIINTLLVDGNALFKVGFYGAKGEYNHIGQHIGGIYQFLTVLRKLLTETIYHRVFVFWDGKFSGKLRYNIYPLYKSGRGKDYVNGTQPIEESEIRQKLSIRQYLEELCIRQLQHEFVESDDFIAYYCLNVEQNEQITICSNDRDMCQLINENIRIYFCDLKTYVTTDNYNDYFKHNPKNSALIKAIIGDNSDSIKGIKGIKEPTLINFFPELNERKVTLTELLTKAKSIQDNRILEKKKPLQSLQNLIEGKTDGPQGDRFYDINISLVDLSSPMITEEAINELNDLKDGIFDISERGIKNVIKYMKIDGLIKTIGSERLSEYLLPYKKLIERETKNI